jgi:hypothetical protein
MKIQWSTYQEVQQRANLPLQECLKAFATSQALQRAFGREPERLVLPPGVERELVWSGHDEQDAPLIFRSAQKWPRDQVSLWTNIGIGQDGLFPWRDLGRLRELPGYFFAKSLLIGDAPFVGKGFAVLRDELSGQPWTLYKTPSLQDANELIEFLRGFGDEAYQVLPIELRERRYLLAVEGDGGRFYLFESYPEDTTEEALRQRLEMYGPKWSGHRVCIFAERVGGEIIASS